jgi:hypothetical protein
MYLDNVLIKQNATAESVSWVTSQGTLLPSQLGVDSFHVVRVNTQYGYPQSLGVAGLALIYRVP